MRTSSMRPLFPTLLLLSFLAALPLSCQQHKKAESVSEVQVINDISYLGDAQPQELHQADSLRRLNLYLPKDKQNIPFLIWIGGGAWSYVDRHQEADLAMKLAAKGIGVASVGHRLSSAVWRDPSLDSGVVHPAHAQDVALATAWLLENANRYHIAKDRIYIGGFSSGAHLAALLAMKPDYLKALGQPEMPFAGILAISGAYDIADYRQAFIEGNQPHLAEQHVEAVFGNLPEDWQDASPAAYLENLSVPLLLVADGDIARYTRRFETLLQERGISEIQVFYAEDYSHADLWRELSYSDRSAYRDLMEAFILDPEDSSY